MPELPENNNLGQDSKPNFYIGSLGIYGRLVVAPMDGFTDSPFRRIACQHGAALCFTEFINNLDVTQGHPRLDEKLKYSIDEKPIGFQLYDSEPNRFVTAAQILIEKWRPDLFDVNLGCANRRVTGRGAGAALLTKPDRIARIFNLLSSVLDIPVTAKIRLGWDESQINYLETTKVLEDNGCQAISVHARTRSQAFSEPARWNAIAEIKSLSRIPIIANGDIIDQEGIQTVMQYTGCDAVMIGRAAIGNPWLFSHKDGSVIEPSQVVGTIIQHLSLSLEHYGQEGIIKFRKHMLQYLKWLHVSDKERKKLLTSLNLNEITELLSSLLNDADQSFE